MRVWNDYQYECIQNACVRYNSLLHKTFGWRMCLDDVQDSDTEIKLVFEKIPVEGGFPSKKYKLTYDVEYQDWDILDQFQWSGESLSKEVKYLLERFADCIQEAFVGYVEEIPEVKTFNEVMAPYGYKLESSPFEEALDFDYYNGAYVDYLLAAIYNLYLPNGDKALNIVINQNTLIWNVTGVYNEIGVKTLTKLTESEYLLRGAVEAWVSLGFTDSIGNVKECEPVVDYMTDSVALDRLVVAIARFNTDIKGGSKIHFRATPSKDKVTKEQYPYYAYSIHGLREGYATGYFGKYGEFVFVENGISERQEELIMNKFKEVYEHVDELYGFTQKFKEKLSKGV